MGKIWLETTDGRLIHLPVVGDDINTPDDVIRIPTSVLMNMDRCYDGQIEVVSPTHGTIIFDFEPSGRTGSCNQCGQCCSHPVDACLHPTGDCGYPYRADIDCHACQYLTVFKVNKWGQKDNTECSLRANILNTFKGCTMFPTKPSEIKPHMTNCGYSF